jgi:anaerobic selenocysteine-containing dehydrogenase
VRVHNDRGAFVAIAQVGDAVRCGVVAATKGHWPKLLGEQATVNATVAERDSDMGGGAVYHDNAAEAEPLAEARDAVAQRQQAGGRGSGRA